MQWASAQATQPCCDHRALVPGAHGPVIIPAQEAPPAPSAPVLTSQEGPFCPAAASCRAVRPSCAEVVNFLNELEALRREVESRPQQAAPAPPPVRPAALGAARLVVHEMAAWDGDGEEEEEEEEEDEDEDASEDESEDESDAEDEA